MIKRMKMFLWMVVGLLLLACGGCSRPTPAHLTAAFLEVMSRVDAGHPLDLVCDVESASGAQLVKALTLFRENAKPGDKVYIVPK